MNKNIIAGVDFTEPLDHLENITGSKLSDMLGTKKTFEAKKEECCHECSRMKYVGEPCFNKNCLCHKMKEPECEYGHICTSGCQKDFDCPCLADHCCSVTPKADLCGEVEDCEYCNSLWRKNND